MKFFKYILFFLLIVIIGLAIYIAVQPNEFEFSRNKVINAPASVLYDKVNEFKEWPSFSPWLEKDKEAALTYGEKSSGMGGNYSWKGDILGEGSIETTNTVENTSLSQHISFIKPFESESDINWTFEPTDNGTNVTWNMIGKQDFMTKLYTTFMGSIEDNTGPDFERGLFKLDSVTIADMKKYTVIVDGVTEHSGGFYLYNTTSCKMDEFKTKMAEMMPRIGKFVGDNNISMAGAPYVLYHKWDEENNAVMFSCCVPTTSRVITTESDILTGKLKPFKAVKTTLKGDYDNLKEAWEITMKYASENSLQLTETGPMMEAYLTDPMTEPNPAKWITEIFIAVK